MQSLHSPPVYLHSIHSSVSTRIMHIPREKTGQKPLDMTIHSAQLLSMVTELNISILYDREKDHASCQGSHSDDSSCEMLATLPETAREISARYFQSCHGRTGRPI